MPVGPDFISLQVRDLDIAAAFYEERLGLRRAPASPPGAAVFAGEPIPFGVAVWVKVDAAQVLHDRLAEHGVRIVTAPFDGPFGRTFAVSDPDGYVITIHDGA
jgi:predicted enzyme related to lactoylglutathione lyase